MLRLVMILAAMIHFHIPDTQTIGSTGKQMKAYKRLHLLFDTTLTITNNDHETELFFFEMLLKRISCK